MPETPAPWPAPKRVLVTGAAGRLGRVVVAHLAAQGVETVGVDRVEATDTGADRLLAGDATDPALVRDALDGVDGVIHLAALASPAMGTPEEVFGVNSLGTFAVLDTAGRAGVTRAVFASSQSIYGLAFSPEPQDPFYVPIDADHPLQIADPYALSKQADEATGVMIARRYGMAVAALRYPMLGSVDGRLAEIAAHWRDDPAQGARPLWAYLDDRDAAAVAWLALRAPLSGYHMFQVAAPETIVPQATAELLDRFFPRVPRRRAFTGREVPFDTSAATGVLGFRPAHRYRPEGV
jgi:nucleoside-diphosphate-sugar epimerase